MRALVYLFVTNLKNNFKELLHRPSKLILYLFLLAMVGFSLIGSQNIPIRASDLRPIAELRAMIFGLYGALFIVSALKGLSSGASFYSMADVQLLFPMPISPRPILLYGLLRQMGTSLLLGFFLLFQYGWLRNLYGITPSVLVAILVGYAFCLFCGQLTAMVIYSLTSGNDRAQKMVQVGIYAICALFIAYCVLPGLRQTALNPIIGAADSWFVSLFPVAGWLRACTFSMLDGMWGQAAVFGLLVVLYIGGLLFTLFRTHADFYEDVLQATEISATAITAKKEGRMLDAAPRHVKVGKTGIGKGMGAGVFFHKHMLENRRSRFLMLDKTAMIFLAFSWGFAYFMRSLENPLGIVVFTTYMQIFSIGTGRWVRELMQPFVYLIPEPPFFKLLHICAEGMCSIAIESVVMYIPIGIIMGFSIPVLFACILLRIGFGLLFFSANILSERIFGSIVSKMILMLFYLLLILVLCAPGVIAAFIVSFALPSFGIALPLLVSCAWNVLCAGLVCFFCRDILNYAELNNR